MPETAHLVTDRRPDAAVRLERFRTRNGAFERILTLGDGRTVTSALAAAPDEHTDPASADDAERAWLRSTTAPATTGTRRPVRTIDLFAGCGGLSIGLAEAARALNRPFRPLLAVDLDATATATYAANFPTAAALRTDVEDLLPGAVGSALTPAERLLARQHREVDVLVGGPPCQGHSDFNNRTRHADDKNELYRTMVRAAEVFTPEHVLIENVPGAVNDRRAVVQRTADALTDLGYDVGIGVVNLSEIGVPQTRRRLILMASRTRSVTPTQVVERHRRQTRTVAWAFQDLENADGTGLIDAAAQSAADTRRRIDHLFDHDRFDLPEESDGHIVFTLNDRPADPVYSVRSPFVISVAEVRE